MSFLYPLFLLGGLAVAVPVVLHLLRRDITVDVPFTAVHLLKPVPIERARQRRLRDLLLLAARIAALVLLATAFARPYRAAGAAGAPLLIVAVDRSYSMGAPGMIERTRARAVQEVTQRGGRVAVLAFDERAEVVAQPGTAAAAREAIAAVTPGFGGTRYSKVLSRAAEIAAGSPATLVLVTDAQRVGWEAGDRAALPSTMTLSLASIDGPASNAALTDFRIDHDQLIATVRAGEAAPATGRLTVSAGGSALGSVAVDVPAGTARELIVPARLPETGEVTARIDDPAGVPADDSRVIDAAPAAPARVLVIAGDRTSRQPAFFLTRALDAGSRSRADAPLQVEVHAPAELAGWDARRWSGAAALVLLSTRGLDRDSRARLGRFLSGGGGVFIAAGPDLESSVLATVPGLEAIRDARLGAAGPRSLAVTDLRHPIFRPFGALAANLGQVRFSDAWVLPAAGWTVAASFTDGSPALLERQTGAGRVVMFASDLDRDWNDFPLHPGFVPFVNEAVRFVIGERMQRRVLTVGDAPDGVPPRPGVHRLADGRTVVVNVDPREGQLASLDEDAFRSMVDQVQTDPARAAQRRAQQIEAGQSYWQYGLVLMLAVLVAESVVGRV